jgi:tRNA1(Val) A37 N6-methylase TrmN6
VLEHADIMRRQVSPGINQTRKADLGQFMTPAGVARFMASLFSDRTLQTCRLLDPGAGIGALSCAFLDRLATGRFRHVEVAAFEIDRALRAHLEKTLSGSAARISIQPRIVAGEFIEHAVRESLHGPGGYTHAILNPPCKKINSNSQHRLELRRVGIETVNLYSAFVALALELLAPSGQLVAIIPRSFCNGPYYPPFRDFVLERAAIRHMHLFHSPQQGIQG